MSSRNGKEMSPHQEQYVLSVVYRNEQWAIAYRVFVMNQCRSEEMVFLILQAMKQQICGQPLSHLLPQVKLSLRLHHFFSAIHSFSMPLAMKSAVPIVLIIGLTPVAVGSTLESATQKLL